MSAVDQSVIEAALAHIWQLSGLPTGALSAVSFETGPRTLPSSFYATEAATATVAAAGLAAAELWRLRSGESQNVSVATRHVEASFLGERYLRIDGKEPPDHWGPVAGLYQCGDGRWVRIHANYPHHEAGVLEILGCERTKESAQAALDKWSAQDFEDAAGEKGLVVFMMRAPAEWAAHGQGDALSALDLFDIEKIADGPAMPLPATGDMPLAGVRVLDLTRVIAGPVCGRTLAGYGADVLRISSARLPRDPLSLEIDGGRGKRSAFIDLKTPDGRSTLEGLAREADVFVQGYRPGAIDAQGFSPERLAELRPGVVSVSLSAWGHVGPWSHRRGFDSLVQTASGINWAEGEAAGVAGPRALPCQALDHCSGYLLALGAMAGLYKRATEGGSWRVRAALARTGRWLTRLGRVGDGFANGQEVTTEVDDLVVPVTSDYGQLRVIAPAARLDRTPALSAAAPMRYPHDAPETAARPTWL